MKKYRREKLNSLLEREVADLLLKNFDAGKGVFISVVRAEVSDDITNAKIYISVYPEEKEKEVLEKLQKEIYHLQQILNKKLFLNFVPKIIFKVSRGYKGLVAKW